VFAIYVAGIAASILAQIPAAMILVAVTMASGGKPEDIFDAVATPGGFTLMAIGPQLALLTTWWLASTFGDPRTRRHRAIGRSPLSTAATLCLLPATLAVLWLGTPLAYLAADLFGEWSSDTLGEQLMENLNWRNGLPFVAFIAIAPGFVEELFFRGYMQRRLLDRWSPAVVLPLVAVLFAASHGTPVWALAVLPIALWFGVLAWRTGSLWPGILCHAFVNGSVNLWRVGAAAGTWPDEVGPTVYYTGLGACLACLAVSLVVLYRTTPHNAGALQDAA
jgi:membrane protease YdiL (CAAX protease family)